MRYGTVMDIGVVFAAVLPQGMVLKSKMAPPHKCVATDTITTAIIFRTIPAFFCQQQYKLVIIIKVTINPTQLCLNPI